MTALPILLPRGFAPLVKIDDTVEVGQAIAENTSQNEEVIDIAEQLGISLDRARKVIKKNPGDTVAVGDVLAIHTSLFGLTKHTVISKVDGTVARFERGAGKLIIKTSYTSLTEKLVSPVAGTVALCDNEKIVISTDKNVVQGSESSGTHGEGELFFLQASFSEEERENKLYFLDSQAIGKVIVGGNLTREILVKGIGIGAVGLVGTSISTDDLAYVNQKHNEMPVLQIEKDALVQLIQWKGKKVYLNAETKAIILLQS